MKRCALLVLMVVTATFSARPWAQTVSSEPAEQLRALESAFDVAIVRRDVFALDQMTSDDFVLVSLNGDLHAKAEVLKYIASLAGEYEYRQTDNLRIRVYGDAAVVMGRTIQTVQENGKDHSDAYLSGHVYIRKKGRWLLVASQLTHVAVQ